MLLKEFSEKLILKMSADDNKSMKRDPACKLLKYTQYCSISESKLFVKQTAPCADPESFVRGDPTEKLLTGTERIKSNKHTWKQESNLIDGWLRMGLLPPLGNFADISYLVEN